MKDKLSVTLGECQLIQKAWEEALDIDRTTETRINRMREEVDELYELSGEGLNEKVKDPDYARRMGEEIIDIFIIGLSILDTMGLDAQQMFLAKMQRNYEKYDPVKARRYREEGLTSEETLTRLKSEWNGKML